MNALQKPIPTSKRPAIASALVRAKSIRQISEIIKNERIPIIATHPFAPETGDYLGRLRKPEIYAKYKAGVFEFLLSTQDVFDGSLTFLLEPFADIHVDNALRECGLKYGDIKFFYSMGGEIINPIPKTKEPHPINLGGNLLCVPGRV